MSCVCVDRCFYPISDMYIGFVAMRGKPKVTHVLNGKHLLLGGTHHRDCLVYSYLLAVCLHVCVYTCVPVCTCMLRMWKPEDSW